MLVRIGYLALQAVVALVIDNLTGGFNGGNLALMSTGLAGFAALISPAQPFKNSEAGHEA